MVDDFCVFCGDVQICNGFLLLQKNEYDTISKECDKVSSKIYQVDISKLGEINMNKVYTLEYIADCFFENRY